jgi:hypothetical protein
MWTYTTYILGKYSEKCEQGPQKGNDMLFKDISGFVFDVLWRKEKLVFHDGDEDLFDDFRYLEKIGIVELEGNDKGNFEKTHIRIKDKEKLAKIVKVVEDSANLTGVKLFDEYTSRINRAIEKTCVAPIQ